MNNYKQQKDLGQRKFVKSSQSTVSGLTCFKKRSHHHTLCPGFIEDPFQKAFLCLLFLKKEFSKDDYIHQRYNSPHLEGDQEMIKNFTECHSP